MRGGIFVLLYGYMIMENCESILSVMRSFGRQLISETATFDTARKHVTKIRNLGYNDDTHVHFSNFVSRNHHLKPRGDDTVRWFGEILVDYIFLEAARSFTKQDLRGWQCSDCGCCCLWPFMPPKFDLTDSPYCQVAFTFINFGYHPYQNLDILVDSRKYDDIFDQILLWRTYYRELFGASRYGLHIRSISAYRWCRNEERKLVAEDEKKQADFYKKRAFLIGWKNRRKEWVENTIRDRKTKMQKNTIERLTSLSLTEKLREIAESQYAIDFYPKEWGRQAAREKTLKTLDFAIQQKLALKLRQKHYQGWHDILTQLKKLCPACFHRLLPTPTGPRRVWNFVDPKLKKACAIYKTKNNHA